MLQHFLQLFQVLEESLAPLGRETAKRLRSIVLVALPDLDEPGLGKDLQVTAEIAVGERTNFFQIVEAKPLRFGEQRRHDAESRFLMKGAIESFIRVFARRSFAGSLRHVQSFPDSSTTRAPRTTARCRT